MKNYTIRVVDAESGKCLYKQTIQKQKQHEAMSAFMEFLEIDTEEGSVFLQFSKYGMMATKPYEDNEIEYYLIYG